MAQSLMEMNLFKISRNFVFTKLLLPSKRALAISSETLLGAISVLNLF